MGQGDPFLGREIEAISPGFTFNSLEFGGIKNGVVNFLPDPKEEDGVL